MRGNAGAITTITTIARGKCQKFFRHRHDEEIVAGQHADGCRADALEQVAWLALIG
jgi:hypothetical protein